MAESLLHRYAPGAPQGDPTAVRRAASAWTTIADVVDSASDDVERQVLGISERWTGPAFDAFSKEWADFSGALAEGTAQMRQLTQQLESIATAIENAQRKYDAALLAAGAMMAAGAVLTVFTFGASDAVAETAAAGEVAAATEIIAGAAEASSGILATLSDLAIGITERLVVNFGINLAAQSFADTVVYPDHNPFSHIDYGQALSSAISMTALGGVNGLAARFGPTGAISGAVARVSVVGLGSAAVEAAGEQFTSGHLDPMQILFAGALGAGGEGLALGGNRLSQRTSSPETANLTADLGSGRLLTPNTSFRDGPYLFETDNAGRLTRAHGTLQVGDGLRNQTNAAKVRALGVQGDDAGHLIGAQFDGPGESFNMVPQNAQLNRGSSSAWVAMEKQWRAGLESGKPVSVDVRAIYGDTSRPIKFRVTYNIGGEIFKQTFRNGL